MSEKALIAFLLVGFGIATWQSIQAGVFPPLPSRFVGIALVGSVLALIALASPGLAAALAAAVLLGLIIAGGNLPGFKQPSVAVAQQGA